MLCRVRAAVHSRRNESPHSHCLRSGRRRKSSGASSRASHFSTLSGAPGLAQGSACDTEIWPPFANDVSMPAASRRSSTLTSWPDLLRNQAVVTPTTPAPRTRTFMTGLLFKGWREQRTALAPLPLSLEVALSLRDSAPPARGLAPSVGGPAFGPPLSRIRLMSAPVLG